jgi:hypothetical protein
VKKLSLLFLIFCFSCFALSAQSWLWGKQGVAHSVYSYGDVFGDHSVISDGGGNSYETGQFGDTLTFGALSLNSPYFGASNVFLTKYDFNGNILWAKQTTLADSRCGATGTSVALDRYNHLYVTGGFYDTVAFAAVSLKTFYNYDVYLTRFDTAGNVKWAKQAVPASPKSSGHGNSVAIDESGNIYVVGVFVDTISFGPYTLLSTPASDTFTPGNIFIVKYDSMGNVLWARQDVPASKRSGGEAYSVAVDKNGNAYMTGYFIDTVSFGAITLYNERIWPSFNGDMFLIKYDANGNVLWAKQSIAASSASASAGKSTAVEGSGNIYVTGYIDDTVKIGAHTLISKNSDPFLAKYTPAGSLIWVNQGNVLDINGWQGDAIVTDTLSRGGGYMVINNARLGGNASPYKMEFGSDTFKLITNKASATVFLQFDSAGDTRCGNIFSEGSEDDGDAVAVDHAGKYIFMSGDIDSTTIVGSDTLLVHGGEGSFVLRWQPCNSNTEGINEVPNKSDAKLFPNPNNGQFTIESSVVSGVLSVKIYNMLGEKVLEETLQQAQGDNSINLSSQPDGVYLYRVLTETGAFVSEGKFIIQK